MDYQYITAPLIGAIIGYSTNWFAIKMMFRPRKEIKIGKIKLPFTPGIIPKNRKNIAHAISEVVSNNLLTADDLKKTLLSDETKEKLILLIRSKIEDNDDDFGTIINQLIGQEKMTYYSEKITTTLSDKIYSEIMDRHLATVLVNQIREAAMEKISGGIFGIFGGDKIVDTILANVEIKISQYIMENGKNIIREMTEKELNEFLNKKINETIILDDEKYDAIIRLYEKTIEEQLPIIIEKVNIEKIIEDKINEMDMIELEQLILKVMKKELNAIVNLGAIIGLLLGAINILI